MEAVRCLWVQYITPIVPLSRPPFDPQNTPKRHDLSTIPPRFVSTLAGVWPLPLRKPWPQADPRVLFSTYRLHPCRHYVTAPCARRPGSQGGRRPGHGGPGRVRGGARGGASQDHQPADAREPRQRHGTPGNGRHPPPQPARTTATRTPPTRTSPNSGHQDATTERRATAPPLSKKGRSTSPNRGHQPPSTPAPKRQAEGKAANHRARRSDQNRQRPPKGKPEASTTPREAGGRARRREPLHRKAPHPSLWEVGRGYTRSVPLTIVTPLYDRYP